MIISWACRMAQPALLALDVGGVQGDVMPPLVEAIDDVGLAHAAAGTERDAGQRPDAGRLLEPLLPPLRRGDDLFEQVGVADEGGHLGGDGDKHADFAGGEEARLDGLHDEHPLDLTALDERHAEKGAIGVFAGLGEVLEARMLEGILDHDGGAALGHESGEALFEAHAHPADRLRLEAECRPEDQFAGLGFEEVDRADRGLEAIADKADDVGQRLVRVVAMGNESAALLEGEEQRAIIESSWVHHDFPP
jgi:hypothetical protein